MALWIIIMRSQCSPWKAMNAVSNASPRSWSISARPLGDMSREWSDLWSNLPTCPSACRWDRYLTVCPARFVWDNGIYQGDPANERTFGGCHPALHRREGGSPWMNGWRAYLEMDRNGHPWKSSLWWEAGGRWMNGFLYVSYYLLYYDGYISPWVVPPSSCWLAGHIPSPLTTEAKSSIPSFLPSLIGRLWIIRNELRRRR